MRYSSGRSYEKSSNMATVLTTQQDSVHSLTASKPKPGSRCYRSSSCSSSLDGSPRAKVRGFAFERAMSAGERIETPTLSRGAASSSSLLLEANGPIRRSSAGHMSYSLNRQRSGRRPGSKSPPRNAGQGVSRRPSGGPPSSRGTPGRKSAVSIAVTGAPPVSLAEPEAEAEPARPGPETHQKLTAAQAARAAHAAAYYQEMNFAKRHAEVEEVKGGDELKLRACLLPSETISWQDIQIVSLISGGSFGQVYLARHAGREVCVKRCLLRSDGSMTSEQLRNLEREINSYKIMKHDYIVKYIGCVLEYPNLAIVTEYLSNGNLFDLLYINGIALKAALRLKISIQTTVAIQYMHELKPPLIHRDLKTQNLVLDKQWNIKVCDFGKTQELHGESVTITHQDTGGSPRYMAPECFLVGQRITEKVDIWSLGCCLVEILGGPLPYEHVPQMSEVHALLAQCIPPLVPQWFAPNAQPMLKKCFEFDPPKRINLPEILLTLRGLTPQDLERSGMEARRTH